MSPGACPSKQRESPSREGSMAANCRLCSHMTPLVTVPTCVQVLQPLLLLYSRDDPLAPAERIDDFAADVRKAGADVIAVTWPQSLHVGEGSRYCFLRSKDWCALACPVLRDLSDIVALQHGTNVVAALVVRLKQHAKWLFSKFEVGGHRQPRRRVLAWSRF